MYVTDVPVVDRQARQFNQQVLSGQATVQAANRPVRPTYAQQAKAHVPATDKQRSFIESLLTQRDLTGTKYQGWAPDWSKATKQSASAVIEYLLTLPKTSNAPDTANPETPAVPAGRYAIEGNDGVLRFYKVDRPTEGQWAGFTFVKVMASDEEHPVRNRGARDAILAKIAIDPAGASARYGHEIGSCGVCGRTLTDEDSRARGIGPKCAAKMDW